MSVTLRDRILFYSSMSVIVCFLLIGLDYFYQQYRPISIITVHTDEAPVLNPGKKVKRGDEVEYIFRYSKHRPYNGVVSRMLINDRIIQMSSTECASLPVGDNQERTIRVLIPKNIFPARYYLLNTIRYPINDNRNIVVNYRTEWFEVTE